MCLLRHPPHCSRPFPSIYPRLLILLTIQLLSSSLLFYIVLLSLISSVLYPTQYSLLSPSPSPYSIPLASYLRPLPLPIPFSSQLTHSISQIPFPSLSIHPLHKTPSTPLSRITSPFPFLQNLITLRSDKIRILYYFKTAAHPTFS